MGLQIMALLLSQAEGARVKIVLPLVRKMLRIGVKTGLLVAILLAVMKLVQARRTRPEDEWAPAGPESWPPVQDTVDVEPPAPVVTRPTPPVKKAPPQKIPAARKAPASKKAPATRRAPSARKAADLPPTKGRTTWVGPTGRICPPSHPVKAKLSSRIFHLPGMAAYNRTTPDRCYVDESSAVEDGFTKSKR